MATAERLVPSKLRPEGQNGDVRNRRLVGNAPGPLAIGLATGGEGGVRSSVERSHRVQVARIGGNKEAGIVAIHLAAEVRRQGRCHSVADISGSTVGFRSQQIIMQPIQLQGEAQFACRLVGRDDVRLVTHLVVGLCADRVCRVFRTEMRQCQYRQLATGQTVQSESDQTGRLGIVVAPRERRAFAGIDFPIQVERRADMGDGLETGVLERPEIEHVGMRVERVGARIGGLEADRRHELAELEVDTALDQPGSMQEQVGLQHGELVAVACEVVEFPEIVCVAYVRSVASLQHEAEIVAAGRAVDRTRGGELDLVQQNRVGLVIEKTSVVQAVRRPVEVTGDAGIDLSAVGDRTCPALRCSRRSG